MYLHDFSPEGDQQLAFRITLQVVGKVQPAENRNANVSVPSFFPPQLSFSFEAGRRCQTGEGSFEFTTNNGERIFRIVSDAIQNLPSAEKPANKPKNSKKADPVPQSMDDMCVYSAVNHTPSDSAGQDAMLSSGPKQRSLKKLTPTFRTTSLMLVWLNEGKCLHLRYKI